MAELLLSDRLQPCLLDRLTDENPESKKEGRDQRVVSLRRYREAVLRDLSWLLNAKNLSSLQDVSDYPEVSTSVLNYGMPDVAGTTVSGLNPGEVELILRKAVEAYEPRVVPNTLSVRTITSDDGSQGNVLSFEIRADLWAEPINEVLFVKTNLDLETGDFSF
jgi:type VI secretion system protein ImpF